MACACAGDHTPKLAVLTGRPVQREGALFPGVGWLSVEERGAAIVRGVNKPDRSGGMWFLGGVLAASLGVGCVHKPEMHLDHAEISGVQLATMPPPLPPSIVVVMTVVIRVYNPNGYDVAVRAVRGQTVLGGEYALPVMFQAPPDGVWLPAGQTTQVRVPIQVPVQTAIGLLQRGVAAPTIEYRFTGTADVTATHTFQLEKDNYSVDETGTITRGDMLAVIPNSIAAAARFPPR